LPLGDASSYSLKALNGTRQRCAGPNSGRQCALFTLRMLVTGAPPNCGGPGRPQRIFDQCRLSPSLGRNTGPKLFGNTSKTALPRTGGDPRFAPLLEAVVLLFEAGFANVGGVTVAHGANTRALS
jgi:hypothetical protein